MPAVVETQPDTPVSHAFAQQPVPDAGVDQLLDRPMLQHAGSRPLDDMLLASVLDDDRVDPLQVQKVSEHQPGRAGADYAYLRPHLFHDHGC
jgi:hypothetical protein